MYVLTIFRFKPRNHSPWTVAGA